MHLEHSASASMTAAFRFLTVGPRATQPGSTQWAADHHESGRRPQTWGGCPETSLTAEVDQVVKTISGLWQVRPIGRSLHPSLGW